MSKPSTSFRDKVLDILNSEPHWGGEDSSTYQSQLYNRVGMEIWKSKIDEICKAHEAELEEARKKQGYQAYQASRGFVKGYTQKQWERLMDKPND